MNAPLAFLNGRFLPFREAALPLHDAGFTFGATIVDNARTFRHKLFRWPDHLARFRGDCESCYVPLESSDEQLTAVAEELISHNAKLLPPGGELQLVTFATPGPLGMYLGEETNGPPTFGMHTYPLPFARYRRFFTEGVNLAFAGVEHSNQFDLVPPRAKHRSRIHWHVAEKTINNPKSARYSPGGTPVVLNQEGFGDTAIGSILIVGRDVVIRPIGKEILDSISVKVVNELCEAIGIRMDQAAIDLAPLSRPLQSSEMKSLYDLPTLELLLTGTGFGLAGVRRFTNGEHFRDYPWPGPAYRKLLAAWSDLVGVDIEKQFTS
ncbi:MAG TPA: aminotransferase class IV [Urbifossiella sp.]|jgi:branched-subunit amino acid aminotransferase/4-amino-4-deoxychorismate lyase